MSMTAEELVRANFAAFNDHDLAAGSAQVTDDLELLDVPSGQVFRGKDGLALYWNTWYEAFPNARTQLGSLVASGDRVALEFRGQGTHTGTFRTPMGDIPATGHEVDVAFCGVWEVRDGKLATGRLYFDAATFARQLGIGQ